MARSLRTSVFCLAPELQIWVLRISRQYKLGALVYSGDAFQDYELIDPSKIEFQSVLRRVFLFPESQSLPVRLAFNTISPKEWGWIDITPGCLISEDGEDVITMTDICVSSPSESMDRTTWRAARALARCIGEDAKSNLIGRNLITGGESSYRDIWYTGEAEEAFRRGAKLKQDLGSNSVFEPEV
jgi:hypothetical protein